MYSVIYVRRVDTYIVFTMINRNELLRDDGFGLFNQRLSSSSSQQ